MTRAYAWKSCRACQSEGQRQIDSGKRRQSCEDSMHSVKACPCRTPSCMNRPPHLLMLLVVRSKTPEKYSSSTRVKAKRISSVAPTPILSHQIHGLFETHVSGTRLRARSARGGWHPAFGERCLPVRGKGHQRHRLSTERRFPEKRNPHLVDEQYCIPLRR